MQCPYCEASNAPGAIMCIGCGRMFDLTRMNLMKLKGSALYKEDKKMSQQEYMMLHSWEMAQERFADAYSMRVRAMYMVQNAVIAAMGLLATTLLGIYTIISVNPGSELEQNLIQLMNRWL